MIDLTPNSFELTPFSAKVSISDLAEGNVNMGPQSLQGGFDSRKINLLTNVDDGQVIYSSMGELTGHPGLLYNESESKLIVSNIESVNDWLYITTADQINNNASTPWISISTGEVGNFSGIGSNHGTGWIELSSGDLKNSTLTDTTNASAGWVGLFAGDTVGSNITCTSIGRYSGGSIEIYGGQIRNTNIESNRTMETGHIFISSGSMSNVALTGDGNLHAGSIFINAASVVTPVTTTGSGEIRAGDVWIDAGGSNSTGAIPGNITMRSGANSVDFTSGTFYLSSGGNTVEALNIGGLNLALQQNIDDGYASSIELNPYYFSRTDTPQSVTRHNYFYIKNCLSGVRDGTHTYREPTDACLFQFDANAGTHKAVDSGTTKISPWAVDAWTKININGTVHYVPSYVGKESNTTADLTIPDAKNIIFDTGTGTQIGTAATQKLSFYGVTPIVQPSEYTQTYSTADKTIANIAISAITQNSSAVSVTATDSSPWGYSSSAEATAIASQLNNCVTDIGNVKTQIDNALSDVTDLKQAVNALIDDLEALGLIKKP